MLEQANGLLNQASGTITQLNRTMIDVQGKVDGTLGAITTTVNNTNGVVTDIRTGKGAAGMLLEDPKTAADVRQIVANTRDATGQLNTAAIQVNGVVQDVQQRQLVAKLDDTLNSTKSATGQLNEASAQVNGTLKSAFGPDQYGQDAGANLQQSLANINEATGNLADDTEALKHEFFFKGFFKKRGYDNLTHLPVEPYRSGKLLGKQPESREWIDAGSLFTQDANGTEVLSAGGRERIDDAVSRTPGLYDTPLIVEGYVSATPASEGMARSRRRAMIVRDYLQIRYRLLPKNTGIIGLSATPPAASGKTEWDGVCLVHFGKTA